VLLVFVNGFFVAAEFALVRSRPSRMEKMTEEGSRAAALALRQMQHIDEYIAAAQVGITLASIGIGFLGEPAIAQLIEPALGDVVSHGVAVALSIILAYTVITLAHVIAGEQTPKTLAIARPERLMRGIAGPLELSRLLFRPLILITNAPARWFVTRVLKLDVPSDAEAATSEELRLLIGRGERGGKLDPGEADMLEGVFHLHEQEARQVMTPTPALVTVNYDDTVEVALRRCITSGHTRLLVIEDDNPDRVRGVVHSNRLAQTLMADPEAPLAPLVREALIMPETKPLDDLLTDLRSQRASLAVIVDEFGRTAGIVTIEDIIEEIVGEIVDETDPLLSSVRQLVNGDWFVRGHVSLGDLEDVGIRLPVDSDAYTTIGGYVFGELGRLPKRGDQITANGYLIRVESVRENRVEAVRIHPTAQPAAQAG